MEEEFTSTTDIVESTDKPQEEDIVHGGEEENEPRFQFGKPLPCKWCTGAGARIGCVRDYPTELQFRALETVNLSPRVNTGAGTPIPSPRPSPKVRLSPRLAYMGLPSPSVFLSPRVVTLQRAK